MNGLAAIFFPDFTSYWISWKELLVRSLLSIFITKNVIMFVRSVFIVFNSTDHSYQSLYWYCLIVLVKRFFSFCNSYFDILMISCKIQILNCHGSCNLNILCYSNWVMMVIGLFLSGMAWWILFVIRCFDIWWYLRLIRNLNLWIMRIDSSSS